MRLKHIEKTLAFISENGYETNHAKFLKSTAVFLAKLFDVNCVLIDKYSPKKPTVTETAVVYFKGNFLPNITYKLENTPCENVINNKVCSYSSNVKLLFPKDYFLAKMNVNSYIGIPLWNSKKEPTGLIALMDNKPMKDSETVEIILKIIAIKIEKVLESILFVEALNLKTEELKSLKEIAEESEDKLEAENKKLSIAVSQSANTIVITDVHGNIEYTNPKFTEITGYTAQEVFGKNSRILKSGFQTKEFYANLWQTIAAGNIWQGEFQNKAKNGNLYWEHVTITPIKDEIGKITSYLAIKEDITARKNAEENLRIATDEIEKSERKFRELFEKSGDAILIIKNGVFTECNKATLDMLGYKNYEDVLNLPPSKLSPEFQPDGKTSLKKAEEMMKASFKNGTHRFEWRHTKSSGETFPVEVLLTTIENEPNNQVIHCVWRDITNRKQAEKQLQKQNDEYRLLSEDYLNQNSALRQLSNELSEKNRLLLESKDRFINLFEQNPIPLWEQDFSGVIKLLNQKKSETKNLKSYLDKNPDFVEACVKNIKILNANNAALELFGVKNIEELKIHLGKTNSKKAIEVLKKELVSIGSNKKTFSDETELTGKGGSNILVRIKSVIIDSKGTSIVSVINITATKKIEQDLIIAKEKAEESDRMKTEFIQNMSHEIRTPMNGILGFSELLDNPDLTEEKRKRFIEIIKNSTHQLLHIIDDIMEISVLETKQIIAEENPACLNDLLCELFTIFNIKATKKNIKLVLKNELSDQESTILTDKIKLNKVLGNLLENALKFTNEGIVELGYKLNKDSEPAELEIYVKDTGIGIKPEKQKLIFDRFSQAEKELSKKIGGLGLGLSIAKENTELLGGKIAVVSDLGEGAAFFVTIPYKPVKLASKIEKVKEKTVENNKTYTILVAEDEEVNFIFLEILLQDKLKLPCTIIRAQNGLEAVELCKNNPAIELVLMDIKMPKMDGHKATRKIKEFRPSLPVIAQTAYSTAEDREIAISAGCDDFIVKPISKEVLVAIINNYLLADKNITPN